MIKQKLENLLDLEDVTPIEVEPGDLFDPNYHEAVLRQEVEGFDEDEIVTEVQRGYLQGERVLRPTRVVIAKAPTETGSEQAAEAEEQAADTAEMA
jgi:molecular chaperone GrpE